MTTWSPPFRAYYRFQMDALLENYFTCSLCKHTLEDPRELPCHHLFCSKCLLEKRHCPKCGTGIDRGVAPIPTLKTLIEKLQEGATRSAVDPKALCSDCNEALVAAAYCEDCAKYYCRNCLDHHQRNRRKSAHKGLRRLPADGEAELGSARLKTLRCDRHGKKTKRYCWECDRLVCDECAAVAGDAGHEGHWKEDVAEASQTCRTKVGEVSRGVAERLKSVEIVIEKIKETDRDLDYNRKQIEARLEDGYQEVLRRLNEERDRQMTTLREIYEEKYRSLADQLKECEHARQALEDRLKFGEDASKLGNTEFLLVWTQLRNMLVQTKKDYEHAVPDCRETHFIDVTPSNLPVLTYTLGNVSVTPNEIAFSLPDFTSLAVVARTELKFAIMCTDVYATRLFYDGKMPELVVALEPEEDAGEVTFRTALDGSGRYVAAIVAQQPGLHRLVVRTTDRGNNVCGPVNVTVVPSVREELQVKVIQRTHGDVRIGCVALSNESILCGDTLGNRVFIYGQNFKPVHGPWNCKGEDDDPVSPEGLALTLEGTVLVVDRANDRVLELRLEDGAFVRRLQIPGSGRPDDHRDNHGDGFQTPTSVAVNSQGRVFVGDSRGVHHFNQDRDYGGRIPRWDNRMADADDRYSVAIDKQDNLLVASKLLNKVYIFKEDAGCNPPNYSILFSFGDGEFPIDRNLKCPLAIAVDGLYGYIYVLEQTRLCVFSREGDCVRSFSGAGHRRFSMLSSLLATPEGGSVIVTDTEMINIRVCDKVGPRAAH